MAVNSVAVTSRAPEYQYDLRNTTKNFTDYIESGSVRDMPGPSATLPLGELVRRHRAARELSQEQLAERAGLSARTVGDIECGVARAPRAITLELLARALRLDDSAEAELRAASRPIDAPTQKRPAPNVQGRTNAHVPTIFGRERELADVRRRLREGNRLITLVGPGGVGKTALALAVAEQSARESGHDVTVVELAALSDGAFVPTKIALALGLRDIPGSTVLGAIATELSRGPALLVLDTLEHLSSAIGFIADLLGSVSSLALVATSRAPLRLSFERVQRIEPLPVPSPGMARRVQELGRFASVRLLVERAQAVRPAFALTSENASAVASLVSVLDGLPLAIELAAPRLAMFSPAALATRLESAPLELGDGPSDLPARQRTLRGALAWSYGLLTPPIQRLFRHLAVFAGAFHAQAAARVCGSSGDDEDRAVLPMLGTLVEQSLLHVEGGQSKPWFALAKLVRQYAFELLEAAGERDAAYRALLSYELSVGATVTLRDPATHDPARLAHIEREMPNVDTLFDWAATCGEIECGLRLALALWAYWWLRGTFRAGLTQLSRLLPLAEQHRDSVSDAVLGKAYEEASGLSEALGALDDAERLQDRALAIERRRGDKLSVACILNGSGVIRSRRGNYAGARESFEDALRLRRDAGEGYLIAQTLCDCGLSCANEGAVDEANRHLEEALRLFREAKSDVGLAAVLGSFAVIALRAGDDARAEAFANHCRNLATSVGYNAAVAVAELILGRVAVQREAFREAGLHLLHALEFFRTSGDQQSVADVLDALAAAELGLRAPHEAAQLIALAGDLRVRHHVGIVPAERRAYEALIARLEAALPQREIEAERRLAMALGVDRALASLRLPGIDPKAIGSVARTVP